MLYTLHKWNQSEYEFWEFEGPDQNPPNSCDFWNKKSVFLRILHHSLVSWDRNPLYFFQVKFYMISIKGAYQSTNFANFHVTSQKSEILHFDGFLLSKSYKVSAKKVQKSYLSWHWRVMQSLKKNRLVVSNVTWGIWLIFTQPLTQKSISFQWALFVERIQSLSHKNAEELSFMTLSSDAKFE